jgi:hypothetical protein
MEIRDVMIRFTVLMKHLVVLFPLLICGGTILNDEFLLNVRRTLTEGLSGFVECLLFTNHVPKLGRWVLFEKSARWVAALNFIVNQL